MLRGVARRLRMWASGHRKRIRSWMRWVWHRIVHERGYLEALAALGVVLSELLCRDRAVRRLIREITRAVVVILRALLPPTDDAAEEPAWS